MKQKEKRPKIGLAALVRRDNKVLLGKRKNAYGESLYAGPGGHLEFGESPEEGIAREVKEEIGANVTSCNFFDLVSNVFDNGRHYITLYYEITIDSEPTLCEPEKCEGWEWFEINLLPENLFQTLQDILKKRSL
jgi:8-oxo-dGTP diphosphatase